MRKSLAPPLVWGVVLNLWGLLCAQPTEIPLEDPRRDYAFLELEPYSNFKGTDTANISQSENWRIADQVSFPAGHIRDHFLFGSFKNTIVDRNITYKGQELNDGLLQRYWLCG